MTLDESREVLSTDGQFVLIIPHPITHDVALSAIALMVDGTVVISLDKTSLSISDITDKVRDSLWKDFLLPIASDSIRDFIISRDLDRAARIGLALTYFLKHNKWRVTGRSMTSQP